MRIDKDALRKKVDVYWHMEPEESSFEASYLDEDAYTWIREELRAGNRWAWCMVKVTIALGPFEVSEYLSGCSYENEKAFLACESYEQLIMSGIDEMAQRFEEIANDHDLWAHDRITCLQCVATGAT